MKRAQNPKSRLVVVATLLLFLAVPISVIGTNVINDIRNRAAEGSDLLHFVTDFTDQQITEANTGIPYIHSIQLGGINSEQAEIQIGCDETKCGSKCDQYTHTPPDGLELLVEPYLLSWDSPEESSGISSWPIVLTATLQDPDDPSVYQCAIANYTLSVSDKKRNDAPACQLISVPSNLNNVPEQTGTSFILIGSDYDDGLSAAQVLISDTTGIVQTLTWPLNGESRTVINKDSDPSLRYSFPDVGTYSMRAQMTDLAGQSTTCASDTGGSINVVIPGDNGSPVFTSDPYRDSTPSTDINIGDTYSYSFSATDAEADTIDYFVINDTGWVNFTLNESAPGSIRGTFSGIPTQAGSYTIVVALNDGFHDHYATQIWVINVDSPTNDTPVVTVTEPANGSNFTQGEQITVRWTATDNNQILNYALYVTANPSNTESWTPISTNIDYNFDSYIWAANVATPGTYYFVVTAIDNRNPAAVGTGISSAFTIGASTVTPEPPTTIPDEYPQITEVKPLNKSKISEPSPLISATLKASSGNTISAGSVKLVIDDRDTTENVTIMGEGSAEGSITYTPSSPMNDGSHKVTVMFKDSSNKIAQKTWTFTIEQEPVTEGPSDSDTISILGIMLPRRTALIIAIGLVLLLLAVMIPWLFVAAWRKSKEDEDSYYTTSYRFKNNGPLPASPLQTTPVTPTTTMRVKAPAAVKESEPSKPKPLPKLTPATYKPVEKKTPEKTANTVTTTVPLYKPSPVLQSKSTPQRQKTVVAEKPNKPVTVELKKQPIPIPARPTFSPSPSVSVEKKPVAKIPAPVPTVITLEPKPAEPTHSVTSPKTIMFTAPAPSSKTEFSSFPPKAQPPKPAETAPEPLTESVAEPMKKSEPSPINNTAPASPGPIPVDQLIAGINEKPLPDDTLTARQPLAETPATATPSPTPTQTPSLAKELTKPENPPAEETPDVPPSTPTEEDQIKELEQALKALGEEETAEAEEAASALPAKPQSPKPIIGTDKFLGQNGEKPPATPQPLRKFN